MWNMTFEASESEADMLRNEFSEHLTCRQSGSTCSGMENGKRHDGVSSLFVPFKGFLGLREKEICSVLGEVKFYQLAKFVRRKLLSSFSLKFPLKHGKVSMPFRAVVNENGSWQKCLSNLLQKVLGRLRFVDSLLLRSIVKLLDALRS